MLKKQRNYSNPNKMIFTGKEDQTNRTIELESIRPDLENISYSSISDWLNPKKLEIRKT